MSLSDVLDDAADAAVDGRALDAATILARAARPEYSPVLRPVAGHGAPRWRTRRGLLPRHPVARGLLVAASAAAVLALVLAAVPGVQRALPTPARTPATPGAVPLLLHVPPPWTPTVTERPISRAVYVGVAAPGTGSEEEAGLSLPPSPPGPWLVGADGGELRLLPGVRSADGSGGSGAEADLPTLSPDGRRVAWVTQGRFSTNSVLHVVDVRTGALRSLGLDGTLRRGLSVGSIAFSPDGDLVAVTGEDRPGGNRSGAPTLLVLDAGTLRAVTGCRLGDASSAVPPAAAWVDGQVRTTGCGDPEPALTDPSSAGPSAGLVVGAGLPGAPDTAEAYFSMGTPVLTPPTVVGPDGARWFTRRTTDTGEPSPWQLFSAGGTPTGAGPGRVTDLGTLAGAVALGAGRTGVVVARWERDATYPSGQFGPSDVVLVRPDGQVEVLSRADGVQPRVASVAAAVVEGATSGRTRVADTDAPGPRVLDVAWWSSVVSAGLHRIPLPGARFWVFVAILGVWFGVRRYVTRVPVRARPVLGGAAVAALLAVLVGPALVAAVGLPDAPVRAAPPGRTGPVVPAVLRDVRLVPPRAFDAPGRPRTTAVALVYVGELAGRQGVYATDAATGGWVRLDDLPTGGRRDLADGGFDVSAAVSPNGRYVLLGSVRYDLATARAEQVVPDDVQVNLVPAPVSRTTAVLDDGTVALVSADGVGRLYLYPPAGGTGVRGLVQGVPGVAYVSATGDGRLRVDLQLPDGAGDEPQDLVGVLDVTATTPTLDRLPGLGQGDVAAIAGPWVAGVERDGLRMRVVRDPLARGPGPQPAEGLLDQPGGTDAVWLARSPTTSDARVGTVVTLGAGRTADLAVVRTALPLGFDVPPAPVELTRVALPWSALHGDPGSVLALAPGVVRSAVPVPVAADPWWARVLRPG